MVYAPLELRLQRAMKRDNSSEELIRKRIQSQMDDEKKAKCAHYVVYNDDVTPLIPQIQTILDRLKS
jgi:dephospho-CoA kinase